MAGSGCHVAASDCYFSPENIMISPHAVLKKTKISTMLFSKESSVFSRAARGEIMKYIYITFPRINSKLLQS